MQYFSVLASRPGEPDRICAMIPTASLADAANQARRLLHQPFFRFIERGARFQVRASSRNEVLLLHDFLSGIDNRMSQYHAGSDLDALLAQRERLLRSFFMALYLNPKALKKRINGSIASTGAPVPAGGAGDGGVGRAAETEPQATASNPPVPADAATHINALSSILDGATTDLDGKKDMETVDLGEIF